jgi:hypothetical protein
MGVFWAGRKGARVCLGAECTDGFLEAFDARAELAQARNAHGFCVRADISCHKCLDSLRANLPVGLKRAQTTGSNARYERARRQRAWRRNSSTSSCTSEASEEWLDRAARSPDGPSRPTCSCECMQRSWPTIAPRSSSCVSSSQHCLRSEVTSSSSSPDWLDLSGEENSC